MGALSSGYNLTLLHAISVFSVVGGWGNLVCKRLGKRSGIYFYIVV